MKKFYPLLIAIVALSNSAFAQSPAQNLMPDGSRDMYLGLGVLSRPLYEGASQSKRNVLPVLQIQWSNGVFIAGSNAGWHLSKQFDQEFGPIVSIEPKRTQNGTANGPQMPNNSHAGVFDPEFLERTSAKRNRLVGMDDIRTRLLVGAFYNYQLSSNLRQTNTLLFGAGNNQRGVKLSSDLRYHLKEAIAHHQFTFGTGLTLINQDYANAYFGVTKLEADRSINPSFSARAGIKDIHADVYWNWNINSAWMLTSKLNLTRLVGDTSNSPLVERKTNANVSSAIAYRF